MTALSVFTNAAFSLVQETLMFIARDLLMGPPAGNAEGSPLSRPVGEPRGGAQQ